MRHDGCTPRFLCCYFTPSPNRGVDHTGLPELAAALLCDTDVGKQVLHSLISGGVSLRLCQHTLHT